MTAEELHRHAQHMRRMALDLAYRCGTSSHLGGGLSMMELLSVLYGAVMNTAQRSVPYEARDKFILSKGHGVLGLYTALAEFGIITAEQLAMFQQDGSDLAAHPVMNEALGIVERKPRTGDLDGRWIGTCGEEERLCVSDIRPLRQRGEQRGLGVGGRDERGAVRT